MEPQMTPIIPIAQVLIFFAGHNFWAVQLSDGRIAVVFRHFCEALDLDRWSQTRRIQLHPVLARHLVLVRIQTPGGPQDVNALVVSALSLWLGGFDLTRLSEEKRELIIALMEDAEEAFSRPFVVTPLESSQQPKVPPSPMPAQDEMSMSAYDLFRAAITRIEQEHLQREARLVQRIEQGQQQLEARIDSMEQENQMLAARQTRIDRQQAEDVAWMAEIRHEMDIHTQQIQAVLLWGEQLEASGSSTTAPREEAWVPLPSPARLQVLKAMPYEEYLRTPEWRATREAALKRALYRCQVCNDDKKTLSAHHRTYERRGCERPEDLFVLCESCHARTHPHLIGKQQKKAGSASPPASEQDAISLPLPDYEI